MLAGSTLVVVADGAVGRFLNRMRPGVPLVELVDHRMEIGAIEGERDRPPRVNDSFGRGRHSIENRLTAHEAAEEAFLQDVADRAVSLLRSRKDFHLVLCAPPKALGFLKNALSDDARERLALSLGKDITKEIPADIDHRLRDLHV